MTKDDLPRLGELGRERKELEARLIAIRNEAKQIAGRLASDGVTQRVIAETYDVTREVIRKMGVNTPEGPAAA